MVSTLENNEEEMELKSWSPVLFFAILRGPNTAEWRGRVESSDVVY